MKNLTSRSSLTDDEFDRLAGFLDAIGTPAMNIEMLDGYFTALICGPDIVMPSEYLPQIWGEDFSFDSEEQTTDILGLLMRHWNTIAAEFRRSLDEPHVYLPVLLETDDGTVAGNDWAHGFMRAVGARSANWSLLMDDENHGGAMVPIMALHHEHDPDPEMRPAPISPDKREEMLSMMVGGLTHIYRYFEPYRRTMADIPVYAPVRREGPKVGRNDPCPCNSGRKYKHCCAGKAPTLH